MLNPADFRAIEWPEEAADEASRWCTVVAGMLEEHFPTRVELVEDACEEWSGGHRESFDLKWGELSGRIEALIAWLNRLAGEIDGATGHMEDVNAGLKSKREQAEADRAVYRDLVTVEGSDAVSPERG